MPERNEQEILARLERENERLRQSIQELKANSRKKRRKSLRYMLGKKAAYTIIGKNLKGSLDRLYSELPNRVTRDTFADVSAHLIFRLTRIGIFAVIVGITPLLILITQTIILRQQNKLFLSQNELFGLQVSQVDKQNELISGQNKLFKEQNALFKGQNKKVDRQNDLVSGQNTLVENQNALFDNQNQLVEKQTSRIEQQTELIEADRRSSLVFLMGNIMDKLDEELKDPYNVQRKLSYELVGRLSALSYSLKPYRYLKNDRLIKRPLSPERGQMLLSLVNSKLDTVETLDNLYTSTKFSRADLDEAYLKSAYLKGVRLNNAELKEADIEQANLNSAYLKHAEMDKIQAKGAKFRTADLSEASLRSARLEKADFTLSTLYKTDLHKAKLKGAILQDANLKSANLKKADLSEAILTDAVFQKANLNGVQLRDAIVASSNWFDELEGSGAKGVPELRQRYTIENLSRPDGSAQGLYIVKLR